MTLDKIMRRAEIVRRLASDRVVHLENFDPGDVNAAKIAFAALSETSKATKHDAGKPRPDLIPPEALLAMAKVFAFGAVKYGDRNWEKGLTAPRLLAATLRHIIAYMHHEAIDAESNLPHLHHALTSLAMLIATIERGAKPC